MTNKFTAVDVIRTKRDGNELTPAQIDWVIDAYTRGQVGHEQMSALAMAIYFQGMNETEVSQWTEAMIRTGIRMDFSGLGRPTADKHSTGGVGDKITLPLAPLVATYGVAVPQLSGRGLGHTGGTLDKLEAIPGWKAQIPDSQIYAQLSVTGPGAVICAASDQLAPADKLLYALRDTTATVDSIPLIASSIMSKKIAEGTQSLVLDVKVGSGAFMKSQDEARKLAQLMTKLGTAAGVHTVALLTDMNTPLGYAVGNALEVTESVRVLRGEGPADLEELTCALAREMLAGVGITDADVESRLRDGRAFAKWEEMIRAQGGDPHSTLPVAPVTHTLTAAEDGWVSKVDALAVGVASWRLGAGRTRKEESVSAVAGITLHAKPGDKISRGAPLLTLHADDEERLPAALEVLADGIEISAQPAAKAPALIKERITAAGTSTIN